MDKLILKAAENAKVRIPRGADNLAALSALWKPGLDVEAYKNVTNGGSISFKFGVRMVPGGMIAETQLCFYRRALNGHKILAYAKDEKSLDEVISIPQLRHLKNRNTVALLDIISSFNKEEYTVLKDQTGFTLKI